MGEASPQEAFYEAPHSYHRVPSIKAELPWSPQEYGGEVGEGGLSGQYGGEVGEGGWSGPDMRSPLLLPGGFRSLHSASPDSSGGEHSAKPMIQAATLAGYSGQCSFTSTILIFYIHFIIP